MLYDITNSTSPKMPKLGKGLECIKLLTSQMSQDMHECATPLLFPVLGSHVSNTVFLYPNNTWMEPCGMMAHIVAQSGDNKGQLSPCIKAIMRSADDHDTSELQKYADYKKVMKTTSSNKTKPEEPTVGLWNPPADTSNPAFVKNALALELQDNHTMYFNMPEIEMANSLCGGHYKVSQVMRKIFDREKGGQLRATVDGVTGNPILRVNITFSSTPLAARKFYKGADLFNGTLGRIVMSYKPRNGRSGKIPRLGKFEEEFLAKLDVYLARLDECEGRFIIPKLNKLADKLASDFATIADLTDDDVLYDMGKRAIINAWKAGCVLWIMNGQVWTRGMGDLVEWLAYHDIWSKMHLFSDMFKNGDTSTAEANTKGPQNMLERLDDSFTEAQLEALRVSLDKSKEGTKHQLSVWQNRGFIEYSSQTSMFTKTEAYKSKVKS